VQKKCLFTVQHVCNYRTMTGHNLNAVPVPNVQVIDSLWSWLLPTAWPWNGTK